ncbi:hypothetical protein BC455_18530 [Vibrio harveyi]|nr:hypothetical protein BC455_18530 [Vibrio harveyi]
MVNLPSNANLTEISLIRLQSIQVRKRNIDLSCLPFDFEHLYKITESLHKNGNATSALQEIHKEMNQVQFESRNGVRVA